MASDALFQALAAALSKPSKAYRAADAALNIPQQAIEGYRYGAGVGDEIRKRKLGQQTLEQALGGNVPDELKAYSYLTPETGSAIAPTLTAIGHLNRDKNKEDNWLAKFQLQQDAMNKRQKDRQDFIREMVGAKGNKEAVNQAKNAAQGLGYVDDLYKEIDKLTPAERVLASNDLTGKLYPSINALRKNVRRTAGFAEGGKNLTQNELGIVVDSFEPSPLDDAKSRVLKNKIAHDYYAGTIDLFQAAKLLGPAGAKLQGIVEAQRKRQMVGDNLLNQEITGSGSNGDLDSVFNSEGL